MFRSIIVIYKYVISRLLIITTNAISKQIDTFFIKQFMELAYKAESDLPPDFLERVVEFEKAEKLNPPSERRKKHIDLKELEKDTARLRSETIAKGISIVESVISTALNELPLYSEEASD